MKAALLAQDCSTLLESLMVQKGLSQPCVEWEEISKCSQYETQPWFFIFSFFLKHTPLDPRHARIHHPKLAS